MNRGRTFYSYAIFGAHQAVEMAEYILKMESEGYLRHDMYITDGIGKDEKIVHLWYCKVEMIKD